MLLRSPHIDDVGMARNGEDALEMVESLKPDVVTCDLMMPELDGVGFVRRQMARKPVPILILTASPQDAAKVLEALDAGAVDFVQKPTALASDQIHSVREELVEKVKAAALSAAAPPSLPCRAHPKHRARPRPVEHPMLMWLCSEYRRAALKLCATWFRNSRLTFPFPWL